MAVKYYELGNGEVWDIEAACFLPPAKARQLKEEHNAAAKIPLLIVDNQMYEQRDWDIPEVPQEPELVKLANANGPVDVECLRTNLKFFGYKLGELATPAERIDELIKENKDYLFVFLVLYVMGFEIPKDVMSRFSELKREIGSLGNEAIASFLKDFEESKHG